MTVSCTREEPHHKYAELCKMSTCLAACLLPLVSLRLPQGVDLQHISSSLSADGVLSVEAPAPAGASCCGNISEVVVPVQIRQTQSDTLADPEN